MYKFSVLQKGTPVLRGFVILHEVQVTSLKS